ncbi:MAG: glutaredoxin domain-containing protein [Thermodesulfobacteriota bacterium]
MAPGGGPARRGAARPGYLSLTLVRALVAAAALVAGLGDVAEAAPSGAQAEPAAIEFFTRPRCSHCARARAWLADLRTRRPDVQVVERDVEADSAARQELLRRAAQSGVRPAVPAFLIEGRLHVGFDDAAGTGARLEAALRGARAEPPRRVRLPVLGTLDVQDLGLPLFTLLLGLVDGFNPCAMWVLLFLLSLLVNLRSRRKMALVGGIFVLVSGLAYLTFMAAWLSAFVLVGAARWLQVVLGSAALVVGAIHLKDGVAPGRGLSLSIPESAKPGIYARVRRIVYADDLRAALGATVALAVAVNLIELMCTAGLPALYAQVLIAQDLSAASYYAYLLLYVAAYMLDDAAMLTVAVLTLSRRKLQERAGRALQIVSGAVIVVLGLVLIVAPGLLSFGR